MRCASVTHEGYSVHAAEDGGKALALARQIHPDLVIIDVMLPAMDGVEVLRWPHMAGQTPEN